MPNPITNFKDSAGVDLGNKLITVEYLITVYPQIAANLVTPELFTWGLNSNFAGTGFGQLGDGTQIQRLTPVTTSSGGANWKQVSCGNNHTLAVKKDGTLWAWGFNQFGELGDGEDEESTELSPIQVGNATTWKQVSCGLAHTAAVKTDGTLWTWGRNTEGQLGISSLISQLDPVQTSVAGTTWEQVSCGGLHTTAIKTDGTLWAWGYNFYGQVGNGGAGTDRTTPVQISAGSTNWKQVSGGRFHTTAVKTDGTLWCWGQNAYGQLGLNTSGASLPTPASSVFTANLLTYSNFSSNSNWVSNLSAIFTYNSAISPNRNEYATQIAAPATSGSGIFKNFTLTGSTVYTYSVFVKAVSGSNTIYFGSDVGTDMRITVNTSTGATSIYAGSPTNITSTPYPDGWYRVSFTFTASASISHSLVVYNLTATANTWLVWGAQVEIGSAATDYTPTGATAAANNWKQVAGGIRHTAAIKTDGTLWGWGQNSEGQLGLNNTTTPITIPTQVSGGGTTWKQVDADVITAAIKTDGTLWSWGFNQYGQIGNGTIVQSNIPVQTSAAGTNWKQVATGYCHTAAIKTSDNLLGI
jgi:alpha-tubulin suppressor-like RCC1 family protein